MNNGIEKMILAAFNSAIEQGFSVIEEADNLTDREKDILLRYYRDGESGEEIGEMYGISYQAVHQSRKRAVGKIRSAIYCKCVPKEPMKPKRLSNRSKNALIRSGLTTPDKILTFICSQEGNAIEVLMRIRNVGKKSAEEIYALLKCGKSWEIS